MSDSAEEDEEYEAEEKEKRVLPQKKERLVTKERKSPDTTEVTAEEDNDTEDSNIEENDTKRGLYNLCARTPGGLARHL